MATTRTFYKIVFKQEKDDKNGAKDVTYKFLSKYFFYCV